MARIYQLGAILGASILGLALSLPTAAQDEKPDEKKKKSDMEDIRIETPDGLKLSGKWYPGKSNRSPVVVIAHKMGGDCSQEQYVKLAERLHQKDYAVILFDFRGHGKSTDKRTLDTPKVFIEKRNGYNRLSGAPMDLDRLNALDQPLNYKKFGTGYYTYLINDLVGVRRYLDNRNDANECNSGSIYVIADRDAGPLVELWASIEYIRNGAVNGKTIAGSDLMGLIYLDYTAPPGNPPSVGIALQKTHAANEFDSNNTKVIERLRSRVPMIFFNSSGAISRTVVGRYGLASTATDNKDTRKYYRSVIGAEKLRGIELVTVPAEEPKDEDEPKKDEPKKEDPKKKDDPKKDPPKKDPPKKAEKIDVYFEMMNFIKGTRKDPINGNPLRKREFGSEMLSFPNFGFDFGIPNNP